MVGPEIVFGYFPNLTQEQQSQIRALHDIYTWHNERVNLISRKDMDMFYVHHVLHSLALAKVCAFEPGMKVIDIGTGGGFPGIPLSIMFPEVQFTLCDSIAKKIRAVQDVIDRLELKNATALNSRTEQLSGKYDLATARAVAPMIDLWNWMKGKWASNPRFCLLKGGDLASEMNDLLMVQKSLKIRSSSIADFYIEPFFETKKVISID